MNSPVGCSSSGSITIYGLITHLAQKCFRFFDQLFGLGRSQRSLRLGFLLQVVVVLQMLT